MIHRFSFANFYSFLEEQTIELTVGEKAPRTNAYWQSAFGCRVSKLLVLFGHNASGKTNALKALGFLRWLIKDSFQAKPDEAIPYFPYEFGSGRSLPTRLMVEFEFGGGLYVYEVELTNIILSERLRERPNPGSRFRSLMERSWNAEAETYELTMSRAQSIGMRGESAAKARAQAPWQRKNASILAIATQFEDPLCTRIGNYFQDTVSNLTMYGKHTYGHWQSDLSLSAEKIVGLHGIIEYISRLMREFDVGLQGIRFEEQKQAASKGEGGGTVLVPIGVHQRKEQEFELPLFAESSGTQKLFLLMPDLVPALTDGGRAVLDELDTDLHPMMVERIFTEVLETPESRPAQLICSCQSIPVMNMLDKYQIALVEKNENLESEVWRLDEVRGVRSDDNYFAKYMAGAYGAVPRI